MDAQMHSPSSALSTPRSDLNGLDGAGPSASASASRAPSHHPQSSAPASHGVELASSTSSTSHPSAHVTTTANPSSLTNNTTLNTTSTTNTNPADANGTAVDSSTRDGAAAPPAKKPRKKKEAATTAGGEEKPKKTRKPREKKDPSTTTTTQSRRRQKTTDPADSNSTAAGSKEIHVVDHQPKITELVGNMPAGPKESANNVTSTNPGLAHLTAAASPQAGRPSSSGQHFDPIRSATLESSYLHPRTTSAPVSPPSIKPVVSSNRASASPSIKSLIDPHPSHGQGVSSSVPPPQSRFSTGPSAPASPANSVRPGPAPSSETKPGSSDKRGSSVNPIQVDEMDIDKEPVTKSSGVKKSDAKKADAASTAPSSNAPTPPVKATRQKDQPPPLPAGSGLLAGSAFGPGAIANGNSTEAQGVDICLTFDLRNKTNVHINFAQEVEKKYGFAALHPRLAAQRERRKQVAAAGAALEKASGAASADDMSLDLSEPESNVDTGGGEEEQQQLTTNGQPRKRKKRKAEEYDKDDDFIDDTEMLWENSRLMAQDGFFVYSGPLVPEGEKPVADKADGTSKRGGRGSRGGRGGTTRGESSGRGSRGGGRGSRGGSTSTRGTTTTRKPRISKAEREKMEQEKSERQKMANTMQGRSPTDPMQAERERLKTALAAAPLPSVTVKPT